MKKNMSVAHRVRGAVTGVIVAGATVAFGSVAYAAPVTSATPSEGEGTAATSVGVNSRDGVNTTIPVGVNPDAVAVMESLNKVYVANVGDSTVSVIDAATNTVSATISIEPSEYREGKLNAIAVDESLQRVYVSQTADTVTVIDGRTDTVIDTLWFWEFLTDLAVDESTHKVYVLGRWGEIFVIDPDLTWKKIDLGSRWSGVSIAIDSKGQRAYVAQTTPRDGGWPTPRILVIDTVTSETLTIIAPAVEPRTIAVDENLHRIYVSGLLKGEPSTAVSVYEGTQTEPVQTIETSKPVHGVAVDTETHEVFVNNGSEVNTFDPFTVNRVASYPLERPVVGSIAFDQVAKSIYLSDAESASVTALNVSGGSVIDRTEIGKATGIAVDETSGKGFVIHRSREVVTVVDGDRHTLIPTALGARAIVVNQQARRAYVSTDNGWVVVIDTIEEKVETVLIIGGNSGPMVVDETNQKLYLSDEENNVVTVVDCATGTVSATLSLTAPRGMGIDESTQKIYVSNGNETVIDIIDASQGAVVGRIQLRELWGNTDSLTVDEKTGTLYVRGNNYQILAIDLATGGVKETAMWSQERRFILDPVTGLIYGPDGAMSIDVYDTETDRRVAEINLFPHENAYVERLAFDQTRGIIWLTNENGTVTTVTAHR